MTFGVLALFALLLQGQADVTPSRLFEPRDLAALQSATDPQIRPDGRAVAYVRLSFDARTDRPQHTLWIVDTATKAQERLETGSNSTSSPRWSPDGKQLAYIASVNGGPQVYVRTMRSGDVQRLTRLESPPADLEWSPDGRTLAFTTQVVSAPPTLGTALTPPAGADWGPPVSVFMSLGYRIDNQGYTRPGNTHVFIVPSSGGDARQLTSGERDDSGPLSWTPDGAAILFSGIGHNEAIRGSNVTRIFEVSVGDHTVKQANNLPGPASTPRVSPDGEKIAYLGYRNDELKYRNQRVHIMDRNGGNDHEITGLLDRSIDDIRWSGDGKSLLVLYTDAAVTKIAHLSLDGEVRPDVAGVSGEVAGANAPTLNLPYTGGEFSASHEDVVAFPLGSVSSPAELAISRGGRIEQLTKLNEPLLGRKTLAEIRHLSVRSSFDGRPIDAWLMMPPSFDPAHKYPLILEIHGGPIASYGALFSSDDQLFAAAGYLVVYANPRGSSSYGEDFANQIYHDFPDHDYDDLMSSVDAAIATGSVDATRLFVTGASGGGALTAWTVGRTGRFRAAAVQKPVIDWTSFVLTTAEPVSDTLTWFGKLPWQDEASYWRHSPLSLIGHVTTPTMLVVGAQDYQTPVSEAEQYFAALQLQGVPSALVEIQGASHRGLATRPSQSAARVGAILAWFSR